MRMYHFNEAKAEKLSCQVVVLKQRTKCEIGLGALFLKKTQFNVIFNLL